MSLAVHQTDTHATAGNTWQCRAWREGIYQRHPDFGWVWQQKHKAIASKHGYVKANQWLRLQPQRLKFANTGLYCNAHDEEITNYCDAKAKKTEKRIYEAATHNGDLLTLESLVDYLKEVCAKAGIKFPAKEQDTKENLKAAVRRMVEPKWWRLQVRKETRRQYETYAREMHLVSQTRQTYCSDSTLQRRTLQRKRNRHLLEKMEAENSQGQVYTLAELADLSVSNPVNRRHELMARIRGFEEYSQNHDYLNPVTGLRESYKGLFLTLTTPSKYHVQNRKKLGKDRVQCFPNPKFADYDPIQANDYLGNVWAQIRAEWARQGIAPFGFRMAEPHHDGTPHWHMVLFLPQSQILAAVDTFKAYALKEDGDEPGATENRVDVVYIDPKIGSAAGYCAKYVAKNIDGFGLETDTYGKNAVLSALRIEAWATTYGIRQFQQIGGPSVTVYREARRLDPETLDYLHPVAKAIILAADNGEWQQYTHLMGGAICPRDQRPVRPMMLPKPEPNQYGEKTEKLTGLLVMNLPVATRHEEWRIRVKRKPPDNTQSDREQHPVNDPVNDPVCHPADTRSGHPVPPNSAPVAATYLTQSKTQHTTSQPLVATEFEKAEKTRGEFKGDLSPTWTCVNNCTNPISQPPGPPSTEVWPVPNQEDST